MHPGAGLQAVEGWGEHVCMDRGSWDQVEAPLTGVPSHSAHPLLQCANPYCALCSPTRNNCLKCKSVYYELDAVYGTGRDMIAECRACASPRRQSVGASAEQSHVCLPWLAS